MKRLLSTALQHFGLFLVSMLLIVTVAFDHPDLAQPIWLAQQSESASEVEPAESPSQPKPSERQAEPNQGVENQRVDKQTTETKQAAENSQDAAGPYDMEAIKAFNRALYGS